MPSSRAVAPAPLDPATTATAATAGLALQDLDPDETSRTAGSATVVATPAQAADADAVAAVDAGGRSDETVQDQAVADALADLADMQTAAAAQEEATKLAQAAQDSPS